MIPRNLACGEKNGRFNACERLNDDKEMLRSTDKARVGVGVRT